ncbi:MAG: ATP-binding protein [Acetivibrio sp.]
MEFYEDYFDIELYAIPYENSEQHILDLLALLDLHLYLLLLLQKEHENGTDSFRLRGMLVTHDEVDHALLASFKTENYLLSDSILEDIQEAREHIESRIHHTFASLSFLKLTEVLSLSPFEEFCILLGIACNYNRKYEKLFGYLQNDVTLKLPNFGLAISLYEFYTQSSLQTSELFSSFSSNFKRCLIQRTSSEDFITPLMDTIRIKKVVFDFLATKSILFSEYNEFMSFFPKEKELDSLYIHRDIYEEVKQILTVAGEEPSLILLHFFGQNGIGKHFLIKHLAFHFHKSLLFISISTLCTSYQQNKPAFMEQLDILFLSALLEDSWIVLTEETLGSSLTEEQQLLRETVFNCILSILEGNTAFIFFISETNVIPFSKSAIASVRFEFPLLTSNDRLILWQSLSHSYSFSEEIDFLLLANKYLLTPKDIKAILKTASLISNSGQQKKISISHLSQAIRQRNQHPLGSYATLIPAVFSWDDLVVSDASKRQLHLICNQVKYRSLVGENWGFYKKMPYGRGLCSLFYGSPGTGKTMAVQVIANELGLDLYRIDLSQMISKYIGETEKNISDLFKKAKTLNALLFFDEADSFFAKRSEISDSNDRNANAETAHLLQKIEEYDGITILTTNLISNIDDAFKRRIRFMVRFDFPDEATRFQLWNRILPKEAVCDEVLDFSYFSKNFELSGSNIKDILLNAAFIAASEQTGITNKHIIEALILNQANYGKTLNWQDFKHLY